MRIASIGRVQTIWGLPVVVVGDEAARAADVIVGPVETLDGTPVPPPDQDAIDRMRARVLRSVGLSASEIVLRARLEGNNERT